MFKEQGSANIEEENTLKELESSFIDSLEAVERIEKLELAQESQSNSPLSEKVWQGISEAGSRLVKGISSEVAKAYDSNAITITFRDLYLKKKSGKIRENIRDLNSHNWSRNKQELNKLFETVKSGFWGASKFTADTELSLGNLLMQTKDSNFLTDPEISALYPQIFNKHRAGQSPARGGWSDFLDKSGYAFINRQGNEAEIDIKEEIAKDSQGDSFLTLSYLSKVSESSSHSNKIDHTQAIEAIDKIIEQYPNLRDIPYKLLDYSLNSFLNCPDELLHNEERRNFLFEAWIKNLDRNDFLRFTPFFTENLKNASEQQKESLRIHCRNSSSSFGVAAMLAMTPPDATDSKAAKDFDKISDSEEAFKKTDNIPFLALRPEVFKFPVEDYNKKYAFQRLASYGNDSNNSCALFLSVLVENISTLSAGLDEKEVEEIVSRLFSGNNRNFSIKDIHLWSEFLDEKGAPDYLKKMVYGSVRSDFLQLHQILVDGKDDEQNAWVHSRPELLAALQSEYFKKSANNELRHYFYETLDGNYQVENFKELVGAFAKKHQNLDANELVNLFISPGKVDRKYISRFVVSIYDYNAFRDQLKSFVSAGRISQDDVSWFLGSFVADGQLDNASSALRNFLEREDLAPEDRTDLLANYSSNSLKKFKGGDADDSYRSKIFNPVALEFMTPEEKSDYARKFLDSLLANTNDTRRVEFIFRADNLPFLETAWPDPIARAEYLKKIIGETKTYSAESTLIRSYFSSQDVFSVLEEADRLDLENRFFAEADLTVVEALFLSMDKMSVSQRNSFRDSFLSRPDVLAVGGSTSANNFCYNFRNRFHGAADAGYLEIYKELYSKVLASEKLTGDYLDHLFIQDLLIQSPDLTKEYVEKFLTFKNLNGFRVLNLLSEGGMSKMEAGDVKRISKQTMEQFGLTPDFYKRAVAADKDNPDFYLDQEFFDLGIDNLNGRQAFPSGVESSINFISELKSGPFIVSEAQEKKMLGAFFDNYYEIDAITALYKYDNKFCEEIILKKLTEKGRSLMSNLFRSGISFSEEMNQNMLENFKSDFASEEKMFTDLCYYFKKNPEYVILIKDMVKKMPSEKLGAFKMIMFDEDLLDASELKNFYEDVIRNGGASVREQVLQTADILGSLVSRGKTDELSKFFNEPDPVAENQLKDIASFTEKYSLENKGRTIAVMLFAKEYLPELSLNEVIAKVSGRLEKYEKILEKYSYKNIPEGLNASIGMEYEVTRSTANGYEEITGQDFKKDIVRLSKAAHVGNGNDAVHEIATRPALNPYLMLLETQILNDTDFVDFNFQRSPDYQKGARGFHLTIGGARGLKVDDNTNFLQNSIIAASWGGVQAGQLGARANRGRGVSLRFREANASNNIKLFEENTSSVELRSLSIDKMETLQRAVTTSFHGAIAIQALNKYSDKNSAELSNYFNQATSKNDFLKLISNVQFDEIDQNTGEIIYYWAEAVNAIEKAVENHNEAFLSEEVNGYLDQNDIWVDSRDFGGEYNRKRFESVVKSMDDTLSVEEYFNSTKIQRSKLFYSFDEELSDKLTKINNLFLKGGSVSKGGEGEKDEKIFKGDQANALAMLTFTKLDNENLEYRSDSEFLDYSVFNTQGDKREGYYALQGASEKMLTHATQRALLDFNKKMETLLN
ncbi:MAG: hypothetical protein NT165_00305 [Candidatus Falkowbacteria bacterium]|nr:hypothetical protein [Candidatus Falkowbacteria bacterium]